MPEIERKAAGSDVTARRDGRIEGYASRWGEADRGGDVVRKGAFGRSVAAGASRVRFLWQHDTARPIGVWDDIREDGTGLRVSGRILGDVQAGAEAMALMRAGAIDGLSIGYRVRKSAPSPKTGGRTLLDLDLWEVSLVTFPMLPTARASLGTPGPMAGALAAALGARGL